MPIDQTQRPRFFEGQYVSADDLGGIVDHLTVLQARHAIGAHTWGIAMGLGFVQKPSASDPQQVMMFLQPGYAWDGFGRPIVVLAPYTVPAERFAAYQYDAAKDEPNGRLVEIWIGYREVHFQPPLPGFEVCDAADQNARVQETFEIYVGARPKHEQQHDPIQVGSAIADAQQILQKLDAAAPLIYDESIPQQTLPSDPEAMWLVPIGYVRWKPNPNPLVAGTFRAMDADDQVKSRSFRMPIGVVAGAVEAADGTIRLKDRTKDFTRVPTPDLVWVEGDTRLQGHLSFREADGQDHGVPFIERRVETNTAGGRDLQILIGSSDQGKNHLAVGPLDAAGAIVERVTVQDDGRVGIGTVSPQAKLHVKDGNIRWANNAELTTDQGGSIELGGNDATDGTGTPHIDFHIKTGTAQDFNSRIIADADGRLTVDAQVLHAKNNVGIGTPAPESRLHVANGNIQWGNHSRLTTDQGGSIELGGDTTNAGTGTPYIDFHYQGTIGDRNARIINDADGRLTIDAATTRATGKVGIGIDAPGAPLEVRGTVKLGTDAKLYAPGADQDARIIYGVVDPVGNLFSGAGFTVVRDPVQPGLYIITFNAAFAALPCVMATQIFQDPWKSWLNFFNIFGDTRDNCVVNFVTNTQCAVTTGDSFGALSGRWFAFMAIGAR
jgi:hypothetical protein